jgi:lipoprotein signal peptidase
VLRRADSLSIAVAVFAWAFGVDLLTKQWAFAHDEVVIFNRKPTELPLRLLACALAIGFAFALARIAAWRGLGAQWGVWAGCALVAAGILANGVSPLFWAQGVPDFIGVGGGWFWNLADFEIAIGTPVALTSVAIAAVLTYAREKFAERQVTASAS